MNNRLFKKYIMLSLTFLCISCGVHREDFSGCIKPIGLTSSNDGDFTFHEPLGNWHALLVSIDPKWSDASICIDDSFSSDLNCTKTFKNRYEIKPLPGNSQLMLDGYVKVELLWSLFPLAAYRPKVSYRGSVSGNYFWLSTGYLRLLMNLEEDDKATSIIQFNKSSFEYLKKDRKLEVDSIPIGWPCDPKLSQNHKLQDKLFSF